MMRQGNFNFSLSNILSNGTRRRGLFMGIILLFGLAAFEIENYWSTWFGLNDILGPIKIAGFKWATLISLAACAIDFAGLARIFTPEQGRDEPAEVWYLFGAWLLAATFDAILTWWSVSLAVYSKTPSVVVTNTGGVTMLKAIPIAFAAFELLIRVLLINTFATAGERIFTDIGSNSRYLPTARQPSKPQPSTPTGYRPSQPQRPVPKPTTAASRPLYSEPVYRPSGYDQSEL